MLRINQDAVGGLLFAAFGAAALYFGREYDPGSGLEMGPGYFPRILGWLLVGLGVIIAGRATLVAGAVIAPWHLRPLVLVTSAVLAFSVLITATGFVVAVATVVLIGALAAPGARIIETIVVALVLGVIGAAVFHYGLSIPMKVWPW